MTPQELSTISQGFYPEYRSFALTLTRDEDRAADLLQEAIYLILKHHEKYTKGTNLRAWIKTIIRNLYISNYRRGKRRQSLTENRPPAEGWMTHKVTDNPAEANLNAEGIMEFVEQLPERFRRSFLLHYQGVKYEDIAAITGVPIGTAKSRVFTAKRMLKEKLGPIFRK
jgi:RNA polymerase sigma factor (sigma-70 family)